MMSLIAGRYLFTLDPNFTSQCVQQENKIVYTYIKTLSSPSLVNLMTQKTIGALTIGQSPRPDLIAPLEKMLPNHEIIQAGALDGLRPEELPKISKAAYPLVTRMDDGSLVMVEESYISPKLQNSLEQLEVKGVSATLLLCAGTFAQLEGIRPLFKPFNIACDVLSALNMKSLGLIAPLLEQEPAIRQRWEKLGWRTTVWTADLENQDQAFHRQLTNQIQTNRLDCIVLDYFGHPLGRVAQLQRSIHLPVLDLGYLAMVTMASTLSVTQPKNAYGGP